MEELYIENEKLVHFALHKYFSNLAFDEDVQQVARIGLWKACRDFDEKKGKISTLAIRYICNEVLTYLKREKKAIHIISLDEYISDNATHIDLTVGETDVNRDALVLFDTTLNERQKQIIRYRLYGLTWGEIANALGISRQAVSNNMRRVREKFSER